MEKPPYWTESLLHLPSSTTTTTVSSATPPLSAALYDRNYYPTTASSPYLKPPPLQIEASSSLPPSQAREVEGGGGGERSASDIEGIKAKIMSHPRYSNLLGAHLECQKVGAPPEVVARLSALARELDSRLSYRHKQPSDDPELDQFMEAYCQMLIRYREELTRPLQEATEFLKGVESEFNALTNTCSFRLFSSDEACEGVASSEEDQDASCGEVGLQEIDPCTEEKELRLHLLKKYGGYLSSLRQELSKKKKNGKLPKEARQKLLKWWELHYKWPYPSEKEKAALAELTGLDQKQINNWFINQRKRHWRPSEDMQLMVMDGFHPPNADGLYMEGQFTSDGLYRVGP
ncbi:unnamed protein product [Musa banksii]